MTPVSPAPSSAPPSAGQVAGHVPRATQAGSAQLSSAPVTNGPTPVAAPTATGAAHGAASGTVTIPDPQGGSYLVREPVKTIRTADGEMIPLRSLTPEEKAARRFRRNLLMMIFGLVVLFLVTAILMNVRW